MCVSSRVLCEGWWCHAIVKSWGQMESLNPEALLSNMRRCYWESSRSWGNHFIISVVEVSLTIIWFGLMYQLYHHWIILDNSKLIIVFNVLALIMSSLVPKWISLPRTANFMIKLIALFNALSSSSSSSLSSSHCWWGRWESFTPGLGLRRLHHSLHTTTAQNRTLTIWWGRFLLRLW